MSWLMPSNSTNQNPTHWNLQFLMVESCSSKWDGFLIKIAVILEWYTLSQCYLIFHNFESFLILIFFHFIGKKPEGSRKCVLRNYDMTDFSISK